MGPIEKLRIEHDNSGKNAGWFLERVVVTDLKDPKVKYFCPCSRWLAKDEDDGQISRDLVATNDLFSIQKGCFFFCCQEDSASFLCFLFFFKLGNIGLQYLLETREVPELTQM